MGALDEYMQQADVPGHPEVLKSAGFMCERCLSRLASANNTSALDKVCLHPRLAMSLIYLLVNSPEADNYDGKVDSPAQVARWRAALLPRLATAVAAHKDAYSGHDWEGRYLAILAQAASGTGDQAKAISLCEMDKGELARSDDLAFIRLVALGRARRLPEAIAAAGEFAKQFPKSPLVRGAALRRVLALVDNHQAGAALVELYRLRKLIANDNKSQGDGYGDNGPDASDQSDTVYPTADADLDASRSVLNSDTSGAQTAGLAQITDALLNLAPLPELATALTAIGGDSLQGADAANLRAVLVERWLAEEENFAEAKKYATPAQWKEAAAPVERLAAEAASLPAGDARATAYLRLADGWAAARGKLLFAPLETDQARGEIFTSSTGAQYADVRRRENGVALGLPLDKIDHALSSRDEWRHAFDWWLKAADAAPMRSATRARALWSALSAMPSMALASPYAFLRAGETKAGQESRRLYERLRLECPDSREAREFAVYYDLAPPMRTSGENQSGITADGSIDYSSDDKKEAGPDLAAATSESALPYGETEYRWDQSEEDDDRSGDGADDRDHEKRFKEIQEAALGLNTPALARDPALLAKEVAKLRSRLDKLRRNDYELFLVNFLDDLAEFLHEPATRLTPGVIKCYIRLRTECMSVEHWGTDYGDGDLPPVPDAKEGTLNETVLDHIREAYRAPEMAAVKDYLDFLAMAVVANAKFQVPIPGEMQDAKEGDDAGKKEPVTYTSRDYPKLERLAEAFLKDYPYSRKREAARLLYARALYASSRPHPLTKFAVWPRSSHFQSGMVVYAHRQQPFEPQKIGAALNAYDREFPGGRYAEDIRNLRALLAWRTQDWPLAISLTPLQTLANTNDAVLSHDAARRMKDIFCDGLTDETERRKLSDGDQGEPKIDRTIAQVSAGKSLSVAGDAKLAARAVVTARIRPDWRRPALLERNRLFSSESGRSLSRGRTQVTMSAPSLLTRRTFAILALLISSPAGSVLAQSPPSGDAAKGKTYFQTSCALCHADALGAGNAEIVKQGPSLVGVFGRRAGAPGSYSFTKALTDSGLRWDESSLDRFLANPSATVPGTTMPVAVTDPTERRNVIAYLATLHAPAPVGATPAPAPAVSSSGAASGPSDWRNQAPGVSHHIRVADLPAPFATRSAGNGPQTIRPPENATLSVPQGFTVRQFASGFSNPRAMRTAPNGDVFIAATGANRIHVLRTADGADAPVEKQVFAENVEHPFGIAFYPPGKDPQWMYVANINSVVRFPYHNGDLRAAGDPQVIVPQLTHGTGGHTTRDIAFSLDGKRMFISVGSGSNLADGMSKKTPEEVRDWESAHGRGASWDREENRADILVCDPEGREPMRAYATGIRNGVGIAVDPATGEVWTSVNERDGLGDDLVPDYITHVREGGFYGWPWYYLGQNEEPRRAGQRPDLAGLAIVPDVLLQAHSASLEMVFYPRNANGVAAFPAEYRGEVFAAEHGSWNRSTRTGYKVIRVRFKDGKPTGGYDDFLTGFVVDDKSVWGRPVGVTVAHDGALLVSEDGNGTIWRVAPAR